MVESARRASRSNFQKNRIENKIDLDKLNILTTDDLNKLCILVDLEYPFK